MLRSPKKLINNWSNGSIWHLVLISFCLLMTFQAIRVFRHIVGICVWRTLRTDALCGACAVGFCVSILDSPVFAFDRPAPITFHRDWRTAGDATADANLAQHQYQYDFRRSGNHLCAGGAYIGYLVVKHHQSHNVISFRAGRVSGYDTGIRIAWRFLDLGLRLATWADSFADSVDDQRNHGLCTVESARRYF